MVISAISVHSIVIRLLFPSPVGMGCPRLCSACLARGSLPLWTCISGVVISMLGGRKDIFPIFGLNCRKFLITQLTRRHNAVRIPPPTITTIGGCRRLLLLRLEPFLTPLRTPWCQSGHPHCPVTGHSPEVGQTVLGASRRERLLPAVHRPCELKFPC